VRQRWSRTVIPWRVHCRKLPVTPSSRSASEHLGGTHCFMVWCVRARVVPMPGGQVGTSQRRPVRARVVTILLRRWHASVVVFVVMFRGTSGDWLCLWPGWVSTRAIMASPRWNEPPAGVGWVLPYLGTPLDQSP